MPCPTPAPISGSNSVTISFKTSPALARAAAQAAVPAYARASAIHEIAVTQFCPEDCPYPNPSTITFTITSITSKPQVLANILFGWFERFFGRGWYYSGTANYTWTATAACATRYPTIRLIGIEAIPGD